MYIWHVNLELILGSTQILILARCMHVFYIFFHACFLVFHIANILWESHPVIPP